MAGSINPTSLSINNPGSGYTVTDQPLINQGGNETGAVFILSVDGGGAVLTVLFGFGSFGTGCNYTTGTNIPTVGGSGTGFTVDIGAVGPSNDATHAGIGDYTVTDAGSGYAVGDTGLFNQSGNESGDYAITDVDGGGAIISFTYNGGSGYTVGAGVTTVNAGPQPGGGSGFTITINTIFTCPFTPSSGSGYFNTFT